MENKLIYFMAFIVGVAFMVIPILDKNTSYNIFKNEIIQILITFIYIIGFLAAILFGIMFLYTAAIGI